jgi:hypothetical protein
MRGRKNAIWMKTGLLLIFIAVPFLLITMCSEAPENPAGPELTQDRRILGKANPQVQAVMAVQNRNTGKLMSIPGVVGTGIGAGEDGRPVVTVFTMHPGVENIPKDLEGVPVRVKVTGMFVAQADPTARFPRPVPIGISTGHPDITAGTIGCRVKDGSGNVYALSNNHVYANSNKAQIGDNVLQPGAYDGGQDPQDAIGTLYDFEPILFNGPDNNMDAAIALTTTGTVGYATPSGDGYGSPGTTVVAAFVGQEVQKYGRTTVWTHGEVSEINVIVDVCYKTAGPFRCKEWARFTDQIAVTPGSFSDGGDSGSLIVTDDVNKNPVGLLFAGSDERTLANPIAPVLARFNVNIDDGSGGENIPPTADFTWAASELTVTFTDASYDPDGSVVSWAWAFGDGSTSVAQNPVHTYGAASTYEVTLTVTDNEGATGSIAKDVTVTAGGGIVLNVTGYKVRGMQKADLEWSGATGDNVDIYRDGGIIATTENDGFYTDNIDRRGGATYTYQIYDGTNWSNEVTIVF